MVDPLLAELTPPLRDAVRGILRDMRDSGLRPRIAEALRSPERQRRLLADKRTRTLCSKHLPGRDGLSRAADIVDDEKAWGAPREFWLSLGRAAVRRGLVWGGMWIGSPLLQAVERARLRAHLMSDAPHAEYKGRIGWDPAHVEVG